MTKLEKAKLLDEILALFDGDKTRRWDEFERQFGERFFVIQNHIKFLIGDGVIKEEHPRNLKLTEKGFAIYTDLKNLGYVTKELERLSQVKKETLRFRLVFWITLITLLVTILQIIIVFFTSL